MQKIIIKWLPVFIWMGIIFSFSSIPSTKVSGVSFLDFLIKKGAHLTEYGILYILLLRATSKNWLASAIILVAFASSDEFHQSFTLGREPTIKDVGFDSIGAFFGGYLTWKLLPKLGKILPAWARV